MVRFNDTPTVWHCRSGEVQTPLAHAKFPLPHDVPLSVTWSAGHPAAVPEHISARSHVASRAGRHTCVLGANRQVSKQQELEAGSHTDPVVNLQVVLLQHVELVPTPGSQSSPASMIPFPHICNEIVCFAVSASCKHVELTEPTRTEQIFPMEQGLNTISPALDTGLMINWEPESQVSLVRGQHAEVPVQPDVQS